MITRSLFVMSALAGMAAPAFASEKPAAPRRITIYRDTGCTCCEGWAAAMSAA
jgi:hypothetical protein